MGSIPATLLQSHTHTHAFMHACTRPNVYRPYSTSLSCVYPPFAIDSWCHSFSDLLPFTVLLGLIKVTASVSTPLFLSPPPRLQIHGASQCHLAPPLTRFSIKDIFTLSSYFHPFFAYWFFSYPISHLFSSLSFLSFIHSRPISWLFQHFRRQLSLNAVAHCHALHSSHRPLESHRISKIQSFETSPNDFLVSYVTSLLLKKCTVLFALFMHLSSFKRKNLFFVFFSSTSYVAGSVCLGVCDRWSLLSLYSQLMPI